jgi:hypothetical protein
VHAILADGSETVFKSTDKANFSSLVATAQQKNGSATLLDKIYLKTNDILSDSKNQDEIRAEFPKPTIERRNTGYALDMLLNCEPFTPNGKPFNMCELIAGSEGTLCFITEIKIHVNDLPPKEIGLLCVHFNTIDEALRANLIAMKYKPSASELMDHYILECTKANPEHRQNRFFVEGDPGAFGG